MATVTTYTKAKIDELVTGGTIEIPDAIVGQYTTALRPSPVGKSGQILWDITVGAFFESNGSSWVQLDIGGGVDLTNVIVGQYITANRPAASGQTGKILWDITLSGFYESDGVNWVALNFGSGGVSDGDKGDIVVTGSGTVWTIDTNAITQTKIANGAVSAAKVAADVATQAELDAHISDVTSVHGISDPTKVGLIMTDSGAARPSSSVPVIWATSGDPAAAIDGDIRIRPT